MIRADRFRRLLLVLPLVLAAFALVRGAGAPETKTGKPSTEATTFGQSFRPPSGALVAPGKAPDLFILSTGDVLGFIDNCGCPKNPSGGLSRRGWVMQQLKSLYPDSPQVVLDSGNFSDNPTAAGDLKTKSLLEGMGMLGYAAANVGERELLMGYDEFVAKSEGVAFPFVSANIVRQDTKEPVFKPYVVVEAKRASGKPPLRVGVVGAVRFNPLFLKSGPDKSNLVIASPKEMLKRFVPELRKRADVVVLLAALHQDDARLLAREVPGIDFILGTYGGFANSEEIVEGTTRLLYSGNQGKQLGEIRLFFDGAKLANSVSYVHMLNARYPDNDKMLKFMNDVAMRLNELTASNRQDADEAKLASSRRPFAGAPACASCHASEHAQWLTTSHAKAYETLEGKKKAEDLACLTCHVTGAGEEGGFRDAATSAGLGGVTCESCHGAGAEHAAHPVRGYGKTEITTCIGCHNREMSPKFDYYADLPKVIHAQRTSR